MKFNFLLLPAPYGSLGMGSDTNHEITNSQITGKYYTQPNTGYYYPLWQARLGNDPNTLSHKEKRFWVSPSSSKGEWLQVDLYTPHTVVGMAMNGGGNADPLYYTTKLRVQYSRSTVSEMEKILDDTGNEKVITNI